MRRNIRGLLVLALILTVAAHLWWWYRPGERMALPSDGIEGPGPEDRVWVWIAFPHLNLAELEGSVQDSQRVLAAALRLAGHQGPKKVPGFGPFSLPPAAEMVVAIGESEDRLRLEASVDPVVAVIARLAGIVAGNPWLAGGEIDTAAGPVVVRWSGTRWLAIRGDLLPSSEAGGFSLASSALGAVVLSQGKEPIPEGTFALRRRGDLLSMDLENGREPHGFDLALPSEESLFFLVEGQGSRDASAPGALMFFAGDSESSIRLGSRSLSAPGAAVIYPTTAEPRKLPGEKIFRVTGVKSVELEIDSWNVAAYSEKHARRASEWIDVASPLLDAALAGRLGLAVSLRPRDSLAEIGSLLDLLSGFPLVSRGERQRWEDLHEVLEALSRIEQITLETGTNPPLFRLVLKPDNARSD